MTIRSSRRGMWRALAGLAPLWVWRVLLSSTLAIGTFVVIIAIADLMSYYPEGN